MGKKSIVLLIALIFVCTFSTLFAGPMRAARFEHADRNDDGVVDRKEMHMEKKWERKHWINNRAKVNNPIEAKYDKNGDGWLEPSETKEMLKDRYEVIKTDGKAKVDTAVEAQYDTNNDGILDAKEAHEMFEDIK